MSTDLEKELKQKLVDEAKEEKTLLQARKIYVDDTFIADEITKIDNFFASPHLGDSMRAALGSVKDELDNRPDDRKNREKSNIDIKISKLDTVIATEE